MKLNLLIIFCILTAFSSCSTDTKHKSQVDTVNQLAKQVVKPFSDAQLADTFRVVLKGDKPKNMLMRFTIISHTGQQIYSQDFDAKQLIDLYKQTVDLKKEDKQIAFIKEEFEMFFEDENFLEPAVTETETPDQFVPDKGLFAELKQSGLNGFMYRLGQENKVYIAWSAKEKKVKIYYKCC